MNNNPMKSKEHSDSYNYNVGKVPYTFSAGEKQEPIEFSEKFKIEKKWKDVWAAILFFISFSGFIYISGITITAYLKSDHFKNHKFLKASDTFTLNMNTIFLFSFMIGSASLLSYLYFLFARIYTKQFIWMTGIFNIALSVAISVYYLIRGLYMISILFLIFTAFYAYCFYSWRSRIPLATSYLQFTMDVSKRHSSVYFVSFCGVVVSIGFFAWFFIVFLASFVKFSDFDANGQKKPECLKDGRNCGSVYLVPVLFFLFFNAYWITEVIKNIIHSTICGVYGSYYYGFNTPEGIPKHATISSFRRITTYSFGSICFGSLLASIIQILRDIFRSIVQDRSSSGDILGTIISCFASCIVTLLDWLIQYFNHYCYAHIALYGKNTWMMFKRNGIDALINDCLIDNVLSFGSLFISCISAFLCFLYVRFTEPQYNSFGSYTIMIIIVSFFISFQICNTVIIAIRSGVATLFVGVSEDREVLRRNFPALYSQMFGFV
ncbi:hypothetical protein PCANB_003006 [Pneumocystis canis]|nr:hypothetical protein PCANB_003006 [Pneumocystis canis]